MTYDHRAADRLSEQAHPFDTEGPVGTAGADARVRKIVPAAPRFDYRLKPLPSAGRDCKAEGHDLGRCLSEMRAVLLELGHLMRPGQDHLSS